jgi:hypothetical protein
VDQPVVARIQLAATICDPMNVVMDFAAPQRDRDIGPSKIPIKRKFVQCTKNLGRSQMSAINHAESRRITHSVFS